MKLNKYISSNILQIKSKHFYMKGILVETVIGKTSM